MPAVTSYTKPLTAEQAAKLRPLLDQQGFRFEPKPYCLYAATKTGCNVLVYEKGPKVLVQGKGTEDFVTMVLEPMVLQKAELGYEEVLHPEMFAAHCGEAIWIFTKFEALLPQIRAEVNPAFMTLIEGVIKSHPAIEEKANQIRAMRARMAAAMAAAAKKKAPAKKPGKSKKGR